MRRIAGIVRTAAAAALLSFSTQASAQENGAPPMRQVEDAVIGFLADQGADAEAFLDRWVAPEVINSAGRRDCIEHLDMLRDAVRGEEPGNVMIDGEGALWLEYPSDGPEPRWLRCAVQEAAPFKITDLSFGAGPDAPGNAGPDAQATWENVGEFLDDAEDAGFAGAIRLVRDGEVALERGFGMANRERHIPCRADTVFAIGSAPIDFTLVGILLLEQEGKIDLSDPITNYFGNVPDDKRAITIEMLMTGRSGLRNFHDIPGDRDPDHAYIDRDEAMRRIFAGGLLFAPGEGRAHSHSAWGVLAAIIEVASGQTYQEFTRERIFTPLGMNSTGFHGDPVPEGRLAIGYGDRHDGSVNAPPYWGRTSWLVMGSGGQVSTVGDMGRFIESFHEGRLLNEANTKLALRMGRGLLNGGNAYGFEIYYTYTPGSYLVLMANAVTNANRDATEQLARGIGDLVLAASAPRFTLGIAFEQGESGATLTQVAPGGAAERDGLRLGDRIVGIGGDAFEGEPMEAMLPFLESGGAIPFDVERDGELLRVVVKPDPRR